MIPNNDNWWNSLRHEGLLLNLTSLGNLSDNFSRKPSSNALTRLRLEKIAFENASGKLSDFIKTVLEDTCAFNDNNGKWLRANAVPTIWSCRSLGSGETIRPDWIYYCDKAPAMPLFIDREPSRRLGIGRGRNLLSKVLHWMRHFQIKLALVTNGRQWRIVYAGIDHEAFSEWDYEQWFINGEASDEFIGFMALVNPQTWESTSGDASPLLAAVNASRKAQNELSAAMGERVRQTVELLIQAHGAALTEKASGISNRDIYMAGVHMIMRLVVAFFAESREGLLPKSNSIYSQSYSLQGLIQTLKKYRGNLYQMNENFHAWPRLLALLKLVYTGSDHEAIPVPAYGGELFAPGDASSPDPVRRIIAIFESEYLHSQIMSDRVVADILEKLSEVRIRIRQGRAFTTVPMPIDFSSLGNEYIGILFEGLLNFELKHTPEDNPVVFLNIGSQPALPLAVLESMDDNALKKLFKELKKKKSDSDSSGEEDEDVEAEEQEEVTDDLPENAEDEISEEGVAEQEFETGLAGIRTRALAWAERACVLTGLVKKPKKQDQAAQILYGESIRREAKRLIFKLVEPGDWYLIRWGGTRKGSGTFYTKPQLAIPTVMRTLRPLTYTRENNEWVPKTPQEILSLKVCDPACGSGSFLLASLRYLTNALYESVLYHGRLENYQGKSIYELLYQEERPESISAEQLPCPPDAADFEARFQNILRRYVVERCIYGADIDPVGIELCRLSLWIETLDRELPMTFLDHKIKCGNSLVGTWFDRFMHYPLMAWTREGGDNGHKNGVHFDEAGWTVAIKERLPEVKQQLISQIEGNTLLVKPLDLNAVKAEYEHAISAISRIHELNIHDAAERSRLYQEFCDSENFRNIKDAFDMWCALWFWPGEQIELAPMPENFSLQKISPESLTMIRKIAADNRFFHWELEFPDVFTAQRSGFDAVLGNPPWDIAKPKSQEFFSSFDPLYRGYGKQQAISEQKRMFENIETERAWLTYSASFKAMSNWVKESAYPFGNGAEPLSLGKAKQQLHEKWRLKRHGIYPEKQHGFAYQGGGDVNLYKLFLEQAHCLAYNYGRIGFIVPSGVYSDNGTKELRELFLNQCSWEWLFGFENREGIFDIHRSFKFNPLVVQKGGSTSSINAAFMRRDITDWENAENFTVSYPLEQIQRFSPNSLAILEIQSERDLEVLAKIYANSVLLGDQSEDGWGIKFGTEFHMTNDSHLFPPKAVWEEWGYQPDEYSRWINGPWKPIAELYTLPEVAAHLESQPICAQPPYDTLKVRRCNIPAGIILSRNAREWLRDTEIPVVTFTEANGKKITKKVKDEEGNVDIIEIQGRAIALPLYEGRMISQYDFSQKGWVSGTGRTAVWQEIPWEHKQIEPHYLMGETVAYSLGAAIEKIVFMAIGSSTNSRTIYASKLRYSASGNSLNTVVLHNKSFLYDLCCIFNSVIFDSVVRAKLTGLNINQFILLECPVIDLSKKFLLKTMAGKLCDCDRIFAASVSNDSFALPLAITETERLRLKIISDAIVAKLFNLANKDMTHVLADCDHPIASISNKKFAAKFNPKGFWRVDKEKEPELRQTVLTLVAFHDLEKKIAECGGDTEAGIKAFCEQNNGEGWILPETLKLADYGLGHDERAKEYQPVASRFGARFYDWQLAQSAEESWKECHLHARNLLGQSQYERLLNGQDGEAEESPATIPNLEQDMQPELF